MFSDWIREIQERIDGRAFAVQFGADEKNVRNLMTGKVKSTRQTPENLITSYLDELPDDYIKLTDLEKRKAAIELLKAAEDSTGLLSAFFKSQHQENLTYTETVKLAEAIDTVSANLSQYYRQDDLPGLKQYIMSIEILDGNYWACPSTAQNMKPELALANSWEKAEPVLKRIAYNVILSVMAMYDVEYVSVRFDQFQPIPLLLALAPQAKTSLKVKPSNIGEKVEFEKPPGYRGFRDAVDTPMSLFTDVLTCLLYRRSKNDWPEKPPSVSEMPTYIPGAIYENLIKIRNGDEKLTIYKINKMLCSSEIGVGDIFPIIVAAHVWDKFMVPTTTGEERKVIVPDDDYVRFWNHHRKQLASQGRNMAGGNQDWPAYLARRSKPQDRLGDQVERLY